MWSRNLLPLLATVLGFFVAVDATCVLYQSGFANGFSDATGNWTPIRRTCDTKIKHSPTCSFSATLGAYTGLLISRKSLPKLSSFSSLDFWINGGSAGGQKLWAGIMVDTNKNYYRYPMGALKSNKWQHFNIPIKNFKAKGTGILAFLLQDMSGKGGHTLYLDSVQLLGSTCPVSQPAPKPTLTPTSKPVPKPTSEPAPSSTPIPMTPAGAEYIYRGKMQNGWSDYSYSSANKYTTIIDKRDGSAALQGAMKQYGAFNFYSGGRALDASSISFDALAESGTVTIRAQVDPGDSQQPLYFASYVISDSWSTYTLQLGKGSFTNFELVNLGGSTTPNVAINNVLLTFTPAAQPTSAPASASQPTPDSPPLSGVVYRGGNNGKWTHANSYKLAGGVTTVSDTRDGSTALQVAIEQFGALNFGFGTHIDTANFKGLSFDATSPSGTATVKAQVDPGDVTNPVFGASYTLSNSWKKYNLMFSGNQGIFTNIEFVNLNSTTTPNIWINNVVMLTSSYMPPAPPPASAPSSRESWAWVFTDWKSSVDTIIANAISFTHVSPTFYTVNYNYVSGVPEFYTGSNDFGGMTTIDITRKLAGVGIAVVPAIFGGSGNRGVDQGMQNILDNANNAGTEFINSMVAEAQKNGYAGYNIDWEVHQSSSPIGTGYAKKFSNFLKQFKSALGDLSLSVDVIDSNIANTWCSGNNGFIDVLEVAPLVDRIVIEDYTSFLGDASADCDDTALGGNAVVPCTAIYDQKRSFSKFVNLMRCNNLSAEKIIIGMQADSDNNNPIADACVHTVLSHGFNKIALWPQPDGIYPYLSADGLVSDKKDWYAILANFLTSQTPTRRLLSSPYDIMDGMAFVSGNGTVDASDDF